MKKFAKNITKWLQIKLLLFPKKILIRAVFYIVSRTRNGELIFHTQPERLKVIALSKQIKNEQGHLLSDAEVYNIFMAVKRTAKVNGDIAEVGVYKGGSAKVICEAKADKVLHLFDTFEGLPDACEMDMPNQFYKGLYSAQFENVKTYLIKYSNVHFYKGYFPSTAEPIKHNRFSFIHLDVDLYKSTLSCLEFFYSRMNKGGIIISHDYFSAVGVRKAFDDFFEEKPEPIIELSGSQCLIVKC